MNDNSVLLCLKCRGPGHKVTSCPQFDFLTAGDGLEWFCSPEREKVRYRLQAVSLGPKLCSRCASLDLASWLRTEPPFHDIEEFSEICERRYAPGNYDPQGDPDIFRTVGTVATVEFRSNCSLCLCLFDLTPNPHSRDQIVTLALSWTLFRVEHHFLVDNKKKRATSKHVAVVLEPPEPGAEMHRTVTVESDGLVIEQRHLDRFQESLGALRLNATTIEPERVQRWLKTCADNHGAYCSRAISPALSRIRLIDACTRTIVPYSSATRDYLALSYVWGRVNQTLLGAGGIGAKLGPLPRTLEDTIRLTLILGFRYVWIGSVCINQSDPWDKQEQIKLMSEIYRGSVATVIALSGDDANAGLPRISDGVGVLQMSCSVDGVTLLSTGPQMDHLLQTTHWNTRAWTFQEARLSPRCILVSKYGLYFECNSMHCMETLDDTLSPVHNAGEHMLALLNGTYTQRLNLGILRNPVAQPITNTAKALNVYSLLVSEYSDRQMSYASDALLAFSGILQALEEMAYPEGFLWGLPLAHLNWAMAWQANRLDHPRNENFPTWTWFNSMGRIWPGGPSIGTEGLAPEACPFDLELSVISEPENSVHRTVFSQSYEDLSQEDRNLFPGDPLSQPSLLDLRGDFVPSPGSDEAQRSRMLLFESFAFEFAVWNRWEEDGNDWQSLFTIEVAGEALSGITTWDPDSKWNRAGKQLWLLLTRHVDDDFAVHNMVLLKRAGDYFQRADMLRLEVPMEKVWLLRELGLHRLRGGLV